MFSRSYLTLDEENYHRSKVYYFDSVNIRDPDFSSKEYKETAKIMLKKLIEKNMIEALYLYIRILEIEKKYDEVQEYYLKALELKNLKYVFENSRIKEKVIEYNENKILQNNNLKELFNYGKLLEDNKNYNKAKKFYLHAINLFVNNDNNNNDNNDNNDNTIIKIKIYINYACILYNQDNNNKKAKEYLLKVININSNYNYDDNNDKYIAVLNYAKILIDEEKYDEAKSYLSIVMIKNDSNAIFLYGKILEKENKLLEAKEYYKTAIDMNFTPSIYYYGSLLEKLNEIEEAKKYYIMTIKLNDVNAINAIYKYINILSNENNYKEIKIYLLKGIELNSEYCLKRYLSNEKNIIKQYIDLNEINSKISIDYINILKNNNDVKYFINANKKKDTCYICYEDDKKITELNCKRLHYTCNDCYIRIHEDDNNKRCPFCRHNL